MFEQTFRFKAYTVILTENSITYFYSGISFPIMSNFRNTFDLKTGVIKIENIYMTFTAHFPHEYERMFDFIARGFRIDLTIKQ